VTSHVSIVAPFFLGAVLALYLYPRLSDSSVSFTGFALFMGAAMSITAFPVLARILTERNLLHTKVGALTIACAAVDDVTAWCILALVVAVVRSGEASLPFWFTMLGAGLYIALMVFAVRGVLSRLETYYRSRGRLTQDVTAVILLLLLASAFTTEWLGIHALFGAFAMGAVMPKDRDFTHELTERLEHVTVVFLLPLFFAFAGLRTSIGLVQGMEMWFYCGLILFVAILGKFGGSAISARLTGLGWREAGALGILMNTRGLMELIILTIGLELGVISPALFTMMVIMALITTLMTTPMLEWLYPLRYIEKEATEAELDEKAFTILLPVSLPSSGPELLRVATTLVPPDQLKLYALHLSRPEVGSLRTDAVPHEDEALRPLLADAAAQGIEVRSLSFVSRAPGDDIAAVAHAKGADLVLMGWHKPVLSQSILSGTVYEVMRQTRADVAVYLARRFGEWKRVLVPYTGSVHGRGALELARRISHGHEIEITILHVVRPGRQPEEARLGLSHAQESLDAYGVRVKVVERDDAQAAAVEEARQGYDLVIIGASEEWGLRPTLFGRRHEELARACPASMLIVRKHVPELEERIESARKASSSAFAPE
jgi:Kef-type K+ transport system membrane component KefB